MSIPISVRAYSILERIRIRLPKFLVGGRKNQIYLRDRISQYQKIWSAIAETENAELIKLDKDVWIMKKNQAKIYIRLHELPLDNNVVLKICGRKPLISRILNEACIPVPAHRTFTLNDVPAALSFLKQYPQGVVVKPIDGYAGIGVTTHIQNQKQLKIAAARAALHLNELMVEQQIAGENLRVLVFKGEVLHATKRSGESVIGDGNKNLKELIAGNVNVSPKINDADLEFTLAAQNLTLNAIPSKNQRVLIRSVGSAFNGGFSLRTVYDTDVTNIIHPSICNIASRCAKLVDANLVGIDFITVDCTQDIYKNGGVVNEINTTPALHHHYDVVTEPFPAPAVKIVHELLNEEAKPNKPEAKLRIASSNATVKDNEAEAV